MFRPNILPKKVWVPTKRKSHFFGPNIAPKKVRVPKKMYEFQKKGTNTFLGQHSAQKSMSGKKKVWCHLCRLEAGAWPSDVPPSTWLRAG
jgi:hypothetical protein